MVRRNPLLVLLGVAVLSGPWLTISAHGETKAAPAKQATPAKTEDAKAKDGEAKAKAVASAQRAYESGTKAFEAGKMTEAVSQLSTSLAGGGLPANQMAKALYYRGAAYRKQGKPAQAMSDLTTAIWVSGGLSDIDRAQAIEQRSAAYREAGLGDSAPVIAKAEPPQTAPPAQVVPAAPVAAAAPPPPPVEVAAAGPAAATDPAPVNTKAASKVSPTTSVWQSNPFDNNAVNSPPAPAAPVQAATEPAPVPAPVDVQPVQAPPALAALPAEAPAEETSVLSQAGKSIAQAGDNIGNFFGNMFKGGSSAQQTAQAETGAVTSPAQADALTSSSPVMTPSTPDGAPSSQWVDTTQVKPSGAAKKIAAAPSAATSGISTGAISPAAAAQPPAKGKYKLQVAAVRSRGEADGLALKLKQDHGSGLAGREPVVDEAVIGNFGSFYRVRVGPYADAKEPNKLCASIKSSGFDCLVVTQ